MIAVLTLLLEFVVLAIIKGSGVLVISNVLATVLIMLFSVSFVAAVQNSKILYKYTSAIIIGYLLRLFLLYFDLYGNGIYVLPNSGQDADMFYRQATSLILTGVPNRETNFALLLIAVFQRIGANRLYGQFLLMLLSEVAILMTIHTIDTLSVPNESKSRVAVLLNVLPNFAILSSIFLRESLVTVLITISACCMVKWMKGGNAALFVCAIVSSIFACLYHSGSIGITIGCIMCLLIYDRHERRIHLTGSGMILAIVFAIAASFVFLRYGDRLMGKFGNVDSLEDIANTRDAAGSSYVRYVGNSNNPIDMLIFTIPRIVYFLFSPFPWQWRGPSDLIAFFFSGLYYIVVIKHLISYLRNEHDDGNRGIVIGLTMLAFLTTFIFAWGVSNTGTAARHRDKMVCLYGIIYALTYLPNTQEQLSKSEDVVKQESLYIR